MSLTNPVKTDFTTTDGLTDTNMNDIGNNINSLESSKAQLNGSALEDFVTKDLTTEDITADSITTDNAAIKQKVLSGTVVSGNNYVVMAHGLTSSNIRGVSSSSLQARVTGVEVNSTNVTIYLSFQSDGDLVTCVVTYL